MPRFIKSEYLMQQPANPNRRFSDGRLVPTDPGDDPAYSRRSDKMAVLMHTRGILGIGCSRFDAVDDDNHDGAHEPSSRRPPFAECVIFPGNDPNGKVLFRRCSSCLWIGDAKPCAAVPAQVNSESSVAGERGPLPAMVAPVEPLNLYEEPEGFLSPRRYSTSESASMPRSAYGRHLEYHTESNATITDHASNLQAHDISPSGISSEHAVSNTSLEEGKRCHWCQLSSFKADKLYPVTITNEIDDAELPSSLIFIEERILGAGVGATPEEFRSGCDCKNDRGCLYDGCQCLEDMAHKGTGMCEVRYAYKHMGPHKNCLRRPMVEMRYPIYECHKGCACSAKCNNRVVERGRKIPLEIFRTDDGRGWGVRSSVDIARGQFIDKYVGEIITFKEAQRRRKASDVARRKDIYFFCLDKFTDQNAPDERLRGNALEVDGELMSGPTRFINHSCNPNLRTFARVGDHADKHIHDLAFFSRKFIPAGEELTFDYFDGIGGEDSGLARDASDSTLRGEMTRCLCGEKQCRGYLW